MTKILELIKAGKTAIEISLEIAKLFPGSKPDEIAADIKAANDAIAVEKKLKEDEVAAKHQEEIQVEAKKLKDQEDKATKLPGVLGDGQKATTGEYQYKSWMKDIKVIRDSSWAEPMMKMLRHELKKEYGLADKIAVEFMSKSMLYSEEYKRAYREKLLRGDATTGSYAVPDEFSDMVFVVAQRASHVFESATKITMMSDKLYLLGSGDVTFTELANQNTDLTNSEPTLTQDYLDLIDAGAYSLIHQNLIADSNVNIVDLLANAYGRGLAKYQKQATTVNNVTTTGDKFNGLYSISGIGSVSVIDAVGGTIQYKDILNLVGAVDESFASEIIMEMNRAEWLKILDIKDNQGKPILWSPAQGDVRREGTCMNVPCYWNNQMPATLTVSTGARTGGATSTILCYAPSEIQMGIKGGFEFESSREYKFISRQITFRGVIRWVMGMKNATAAARLTGIKR
jgi:HK97 family phage major capsid protein